MGNKNFAVFWTIVFLVVIAVAWFALKHFTKHAPLPARKAEIVLNVQKLLPQNITVETKYVGYVTPINEVDVLPFISGFLQKIAVSGGQKVKTGEKLLTIKQDDYMAKVNLANATLLQAKANFEYAKNYYERVKMAGSKAFSLTQIDDAKASFLSAKAATAQAEANLQTAKIDYQYTQIYATIDGVVGNVALSVGDYISPQDGALFKIVQYNPIRIVFALADKDFLSIEDLAKLRFKLVLSNGKTYEENGAFEYADNQINKNTNALPVFLKFENKSLQLTPNAYVDVLAEREFKNIVLIPQTLVDIQEHGYFANVWRNNKIVPISLEVLTESDGNFVVANNFQQNDFLILNKVPQTEQNQKIKVNIMQGEN